MFRQFLYQNKNSGLALRHIDSGNWPRAESSYLPVSGRSSPGKASEIGVCFLNYILVNGINELENPRLCPIYWKSKRGVCFFAFFRFFGRHFYNPARFFLRLLTHPFTFFSFNCKFIHYLSFLLTRPMPQIRRMPRPINKMSFILCFYTEKEFRCLSGFQEPEQCPAKSTQD